jgi:hypothetical protein
MKKEATIIILLVAMLQIFSSCKKTDSLKPATTKYGYTGYIKDFNTKEPISDVTVIAYLCTETKYHIMPYPYTECTGEVVEYANVTTDANGYFKTPDDSKKWRFSYEKAGYKPVPSDSTHNEKDVYWLAPL